MLGVRCWMFDVSTLSAEFIPPSILYGAPRCG